MHSYCTFAFLNSATYFIR